MSTHVPLLVPNGTYVVGVDADNGDATALKIAPELLTLLDRITDHAPEALASVVCGLTPAERTLIHGLFVGIVGAASEAGCLDTIPPNAFGPVSHNRHLQ